MASKTPIRFKVIVAGPPKAGTSSLVRRLDKGDTFSEAEVAVTSPDCVVKAFQVGRPERRVVLDVWDAASSGSGNAISTMVFRESVGVIFVYDCSSADSFEGISELEHKCKRAVQIQDSGCDSETFITYFLVATKCDLTSRSEIDSGMEKAADREWPFYEVSSFTGDGVQTVFEAMAEQLLTKFNSKSIAVYSKRSDENIVTLSPNQSQGDNAQPQKSQCC